MSELEKSLKEQLESVINENQNDELLEDLSDYVINSQKEIERLKQDNEYLNKVNIELSTEKNRLNNIINKALEKSKGLQYRFGYVIDDLVYLLMQGSDKE